MLKVSKSPEAHIRPTEDKRKGPLSFRHGIVIAALVALVGCAGGGGRRPASVTARDRAAAVSGFPLAAQLSLESGMGTGALSVARAFEAHDEGRVEPAPEGWADLNLSTPPDLGLGALSFEQAQRLNAFLPASDGQVPATPFVFKASAAEHARALLCLTQAIYYEAALEPTPGQEAVAQTVLNRLRHPAFPKSVCGVVFQGSSQITGCQFSFTCDGSRARPPIEPFWSRARAVAERALAGYVMAPVGLATHYHADYVLPRWGPEMVKIRQFGSQIFYRYPGPMGQADSYRERYGGGELRVSTAGPSPEAILAYKAANGTAEPGAQLAAVVGPVRPGRRDPTPEEMSRINGVLAAMSATKSE
jgi:spore germination cell wall hydrolase CwlJ-like protein